MTKKEKAKELVDRFRYRNAFGTIIEQMSIILAKQCALICVDEIIKSPKGVYMEHFKYWNEVKQEIKKL